MNFRFDRKNLTASVAIALATFVTPAYAEDGHDAKEAWRIFVADHTKPIVRILDLENGKEIAQYETKGSTKLTLSASGQTVFASQPNFDAVHIFKTGIKLSDHGDHRDLDVSDPAALPVVLEGKTPYHVIPHDDHIIVFYDGLGKAEIIDEAALLDGKSEIRSIDATAPHHGVAVTTGKHILVSVPDTKAEPKPDKLPPRIGLRVVQEDGNQVGEMAKCSDLHGEALSARLVAFGCKEGVLLARPVKNEAPKLEMLTYPDSLPKAHVSTLLGGKSMQFFLGNFGPDKLVLIDPDDKEHYRLVELPTRRVDFILDPENLRNAYILTEDGDLHTLDVIKGELVQKQRITEPYSMDGHWSDPRPRLAVADSKIIVTDPRQSLLHVVDAKTLKEETPIAVEGQPFIIVAVGGSGASH